MLPSLPYYKSNYIHYFLLQICVLITTSLHYLLLEKKRETKIEIIFILFLYKIDRTVRDF